MHTLYLRLIIINVTQHVHVMLSNSEVLECPRKWKTRYLHFRLYQTFVHTTFYRGSSYVNHYPWWTLQQKKCIQTVWPVETWKQVFVCLFFVFFYFLPFFFFCFFFCVGLFCFCFCYLFIFGGWWRAHNSKRNSILKTKPCTFNAPSSTYMQMAIHVLDIRLKYLCHLFKQSSTAFSITIPSPYILFEVLHFC